MNTVFDWKDDTERVLFRVEGNPETQRYIVFRQDHKGMWVSFATIEGDNSLEHFMQVIRITDRSGHTRGWKESRAKAIQEFKNSVANLK